LSVANQNPYYASTCGLEAETMRRARMLTIFVLALAALPLGIAYGQYPQPVGACTIAGPATLIPNSEAVYTVTVRDTQGNPKAGQTGSVVITPAGAATATPSNFVTNAQGTETITVKAGPNTTNASVEILCGDLKGGTSIRINPGASPAGPVPAPPDTGDGMASSDDALPVLWIALGLAGVGAAGAASYAVARRR
jgi:hypothetical protein